MFDPGELYREYEFIPLLNSYSFMYGLVVGYAPFFCKNIFQSKPGPKIICTDRIDLYNILVYNKTYLLTRWMNTKLLKQHHVTAWVYI